MTHSYDTNGEWRGTKDVGRTYWNRAICECGWEGAEHAGIDTFKLTKRDYRAHLVEVLGEEMAEYEAPVRCINCGYEGPAKLLVGTDVFAGTCGMCGASGRLRPNNEGWHEETARTRGLFS